jgi:DNA-binding phage protein
MNKAFAAYMTDALETCDPAFADALGVIARTQQTA